MKTKALRRVMVGVSCAGLCAGSALGDGVVNAPMSVDHRGLIEIPGVLMGGNDSHWGAANLIVFGPSWNYSAQDYALKNIKRNGNAQEMTLSGDLSVAGTKVRIDQTSKTVKRGDGSSAMRMSWKMSNPDGAPLNVQKAYVQFPFAINNFVGSKVTAANGESAILPKEPGDIRSFYGTDGITLKGKNKAGKDITFRLTGKNLNVEIFDSRKEKAELSAYWVRLLLPNTKSASASEVVFEVNAGFPPFSPEAGAEWVAFPFSTDVKAGSILDFSVMHKNDAPAGKYGRIVNRDGHYAFEKTGKRVRLIGANLCYGSNFLDKDEAKRLAQTFRKMGYNTVRFHHTDVTMMKGEWDTWNNKRVPVVVDPDKLDRIDYMFAAMKEAGLYVTIDLYAMGCVEVNGVGIRGELKALLPIDDDVFDAWAKNALAWMNHVNPYTGLAWKNDPALVNICPVNEDSIASVWQDRAAKDRYDAAFAKWKQTAPGTQGRTDDQLKARFLTELKVASNRKIEKFFRDNGIKPLISGSNWWNTMAQTFERDSLEVVDHHQYADHPQPHYLPRRYNQKSTVREGNPTYMVPIMMTPNRIFGKPFIVTEYNYCAPNQHRAEGGAMMGAYAALQDWDALYRFAWSHNPANIKTTQPIDGFDIATDPVSLLTERQIALLFARGDVAPAKQKYVYAVTMNEATQQGIGDMWGRGLFPHDFTAMSLVSQIGSQVAEGNRRINGTFTGVVAESKPKNDPTSAEPDHGWCGVDAEDFLTKHGKLAGNKFIATSALPKIREQKETVSDTGEIKIDKNAGILRVATPKTAAIVTQARTGETRLAPMQAGALAIAKPTTFCSVSASAMDDKKLDESRRVLLFHITNVLNTDMQFADDSMTMQYATGKLPYLAKTGSVAVSLKNKNPGLKLYALRSDGTRLGTLPATYDNGAYLFTLAIEPGAKHPTMIYELGL